MSTPQKWIVCEQSGRWMAALRTVFARLRKAQSIPRLYEVRTLGELLAHLDDHTCDLALIEVGRGNITEVLHLLMSFKPRLAQFVALLEDTGDTRHPAAATSGEVGTQPIVDLLWEAGAAEVVESPRQMRGLLSLHHRLAAARGPTIHGLSERQSFTEWAWSTLPWQDP